MKIIRDIEDLRLERSIVILGKFDGFHRGHALLLERALQHKTADTHIVLFTFDINPSQLIIGESVKTIDSRKEREKFWPERFAGFVDSIIEFPFTAQTRSMEPEEFVREILVKRLGVCRIIAGDDFHFGKGRSGDVNTLKHLGAEYGFEMDVVEKVTITLEGYTEPVEISSTLIRSEIVKGNMENVALMLVRPYGITGTVLHGKHLGTSLGFPTVNLEVPPEKLLPPAGVYYSKIHLENGEIFSGITNLGVRPSIDDGDKMSVETNIFNFSRDIYGEEITVDFIRFIRPEIKFRSFDELKSQIEHDINTINGWNCS